MRHSPWILSCAAIAVLSACSSMDTSRPDQMYRHAIMHNINKDHRYNFTSETTLQFNQNADDANSQQSVANNEQRTDKRPVDFVDAAQLADDHNITVTMERGDAEATADTSKHQSSTWNSLANVLIGAIDEHSAVIQPFLTHSKLKIDGAVDLSHGKVEIIPALNVSTPNYGMWAKLPVQINQQRESILVDTRGYHGWMIESLTATKSALPSVKKLEEGALLEIKQPEEGERLPIKTLIAALPKGLEGYLEAMEPSKFSLVAMDDYGRQLRASHRIQITYDALDSIRWNRAMLLAYNREFLRLQREQPEKDVSIQGYNDAKSFLSLAGLMVGFNSLACELEWDAKSNDDANDKRSAESRTSERLDQSLLCEKQSDNNMVKEMLEGSPQLQHSLYLSHSGRILGWQDHMVLSSNQSPQQLVLRSQNRLYNYGRPEFTLNPEQKTTVSIWQLIKEMKQSDDQTTAAEAAETAVVVDAVATTTAATDAANAAVAAKP